MPFVDGAEVTTPLFPLELSSARTDLAKHEAVRPITLVSMPEDNSSWLEFTSCK